MAWPATSAIHRSVLRKKKNRKKNANCPLGTAAKRGDHGYGVVAMAETVHLFLKAKNTGDIAGESSQTSLGRENSIECLELEWSVETAREAGSLKATGRRTYRDLRIRKRIDKATPLILKALCDNEEVDATFRFFRPDPGGTGETQQYYTLVGQKGRITKFGQFSPNSLDPASSTAPDLEDVCFRFHSLRFVYEADGVEHEDTWDQGQ